MLTKCFSKNKFKMDRRVRLEIQKKQERRQFHETYHENRKYATHLMERENAFNGRHDDRWWYICECGQDSCHHQQTDQVTSARLFRIIDYYGLSGKINDILEYRIRIGKELDPDLQIVDYNSCDYKIKRIDRHSLCHRVTRRIYPVDPQHPVYESSDNLYFSKQLVDNPDQFTPEYNGRLWKFGEIVDKKFSAAHLLRLIEHFKLRTKITANLLLQIEAGEACEPNLFVLDYGSYKYSQTALYEEGATEKWERQDLAKRYNMP